MVRRYRQSVTALRARTEDAFIARYRPMYIRQTGQATGAGCIAVGIIMAVTGLTVGIISIVNGSLLLKRKSELEF